MTVESEHIRIIVEYSEERAWSVQIWFGDKRIWFFDALKKTQAENLAQVTINWIAHIWRNLEEDERK